MRTGFLGVGGITILLQSCIRLRYEVLCFSFADLFFRRFM